jgi:hypothetical protein
MAIAFNKLADDQFTDGRVSDAQVAALRSASEQLNALGCGPDLYEYQNRTVADRDTRAF